MNRKLFSLFCISLAVSMASLVTLARPIRGASAASSEEFPDSDLPYDAEVEYIEFTGDSFVNTGYHASPNSVFVCGMTPTRRRINGMSFFGAAKGDGTAGIGDAVILNDRYGYTGQMSLKATYENGGYVAFSYGDFIEVVADVHSQSVKIGGDTATTSNTRLKLLSTALYPIFLGATNLAGSPFRNAAARFHYWSVYEDGLMVMSLIPVRVGDYGFFFDKVSRSLMEIEGSPSYIIGPDKE